MAFRESPVVARRFFLWLRKHESRAGIELARKLVAAGRSGTGVGLDAAEYLGHFKETKSFESYVKAVRSDNADEARAAVSILAAGVVWDKMPANIEELLADNKSEVQ